MGKDVLPFGIEKIDEIVNKDRNFFILEKGRRGTYYPGYVLRYSEYSLLKNLLEDGRPCGVIHMSYGDSFHDMYIHQEGWKNATITTEQTEEFDLKARMQVIKYPLYEFRIFGNDPKCCVEYIKSFLLGKVKYIFITNYDLVDISCVRELEELIDIADKHNVKIIMRPHIYVYLKEQFPPHILDKFIEFNQDKESREFVVTVTNKDGEKVDSRPMLHHRDEGRGYIV